MTGVAQYIASKGLDNLRKTCIEGYSFLKDYDIAVKNYPMRKVSQVIENLRDIDVKSKGVGANAMPLSDLYKQMLIGIFK